MSSRLTRSICAVILHMTPPSIQTHPLSRLSDISGKNPRQTHTNLRSDMVDGMVAAACMDECSLFDSKCPGRHLADISLFMTVVTTLAIFNIVKQRDENGAEIIPEPKYSGSLIRYD